MLFRVSARKTVCDQILLQAPRLSPHCHCLLASKEPALKPEHLMRKKENLVSFENFPLQFQPQREIRGSRRNGRFNSEIFLTKASLSAILKWNQGRWFGKILQYLAAEKVEIGLRGSLPTVSSFPEDCIETDFVFM